MAAASQITPILLLRNILRYRINKDYVEPKSMDYYN